MAPRPLEAGSVSSSVPDTEATSAVPASWVRGGGTGALNQAALDVQAKLQAEAEALKQCNDAFLDSRAAIRVSFLLLFIWIFLLPSWGRASAPTGCSPQVSGRLLSRWSGTFTCKRRMLTLSDIPLVGLPQSLRGHLQLRSPGAREADRQLVREPE